MALQIAQLTEELLPIVTRGCPQSVIDDVTKQLNNATSYGYVVFVRYGPLYLQRVEVSEELSDSPELRALVNTQAFWDRHTMTVDKYRELTERIEGEWYDHESQED